MSVLTGYRLGLRKVVYDANEFSVGLDLSEVERPSETKWD